MKIKYIIYIVIKKKDPVFFTTLLTQLYVRIVILHTYGKHLHDCIILTREEDWAHKTSLTAYFFIEMSVPIEESE